MLMVNPENDSFQVGSAAAVSSAEIRPQHKDNAPPSAVEAVEGGGPSVSLPCPQAGQMLLSAIVSLISREASPVAASADDGDKEYCIETSLQTLQSFQQVLSVLCRLKEAAEDDPPSFDGTAALEGVISLLRVNILAMVQKLSKAAASNSDGNLLVEENRDVIRRSLSRDAASASGAPRSRGANKLPVAAPVALTSSPATSGPMVIDGAGESGLRSEQLGNRQQDDGDNTHFLAGNNAHTLDGTGDGIDGASNNRQSRRPGNNSSLTRDDSYASLDSLEAAAVTESNREEFKHVLVRLETS
jgi:hypothetical protein